MKQRHKFFSFFINFGLLFFLAPIVAFGQVEKYNSNELLSNEMVNDFASDFACESISIHPNDDDWKQNRTGRVYISTLQELTVPNAERFNTRYQTNDREVNIEVHLPDENDGDIVYFRVIDPDDLSKYEMDNLGDDNIGGPGLLNGMSTEVSVEADFEEVDGVSIVVARVVLTTSKQSGDNYQIEASLSPLFTDVLSTSKLIAWKKLYVEYNEMYKKGATLLSSHQNDFDNNDDWLDVDNVDDFIETPSCSQAIIVFDKNGLEVESCVKSIDYNNNRILVSDIGEDFHGLSGVKIVGEDDTYTISPTLLENSYGLTNDNNGGCGVFVEIKWAFEQGNVPKYKVFLSSALKAAYHLTWFHHYFPQEDPVNMYFHNNNYIHVFTASNYDFFPFASAAFSNVSDNSIVFFNSFLPAGFGEEALIHEIGHQFDVMNVHVDEDVEEPNCTGGESCVMSYYRNTIDGNNGIAEFDGELSNPDGCHYQIRTALEPQ